MGPAGCGALSTKPAHTVLRKCLLSSPSLCPPAAPSAEPPQPGCLAENSRRGRHLMLLLFCFSTTQGCKPTSTRAAPHPGNFPLTFCTYWPQL